MRSPAARLARRLSRIQHVGWAGGAVLLAATVVALVAANSPAAAAYEAFWDTPLAFGVGVRAASHSLRFWVNDGLMVLFFFVIGLEIKRELVHGELNDPRKVALPVAAAVGGASVPAAIYLAVHWGTPAAHGWAVPMATDIAFVVGAIALLGERVPHGLRVLLLSLAVVDDLLAILVIAAFYGHGIDPVWGVLAGAGMATILLMQRVGVRAIGPYVIVGLGIWGFTLGSGVHPTVAGVVLGLLTPARPLLSLRAVRNVAKASRVVAEEHEDEPFRPVAPEHRQLMRGAIEVAKEVVSPLDRLMHRLEPWNSFAVMPVFALANAGVPMDARSLTDPVALAVAAGLLVGKPVGIALASLLVVAAGLARLPSGVSWPVLLAAGELAGIGFTMSLFIAALGLSGEMLVAAKSGVLAASGLAMLLGLGSLLAVLGKRGRAAVA